MKNKLKSKLQFIFLIISVLMIATGVYRNEVQTVLSKAIRICLECVGIG
nr:CD1871A family CXXC motif-containing protein [Peptoniphilus sp. oral taxon 836]